MPLHVVVVTKLRVDEPPDNESVSIVIAIVDNLLFFNNDSLTRLIAALSFNQGANSVLTSSCHVYILSYLGCEVKSFFEKNEFREPREGLPPR